MVCSLYCTGSDKLSVKSVELRSHTATNYAQISAHAAERSPSASQLDAARTSRDMSRRRLLQTDDARCELAGHNVRRVVHATSISSRRCSLTDQTSSGVQRGCRRRRRNPLRCHATGYQCRWGPVKHRATRHRPGAGPPAHGFSKASRWRWIVWATRLACHQQLVIQHRAHRAHAAVYLLLAATQAFALSASPTLTPFQSLVLLCPPYSLVRRRADSLLIIHTCW